MSRVGCTMGAEIIQKPGEARCTASPDDGNREERKGSNQNFRNQVEM